MAFQDYLQHPWAVLYGGTRKLLSVVVAAMVPCGKATFMASLTPPGIPSLPSVTWGSNYLQFSGFDPVIRGYDLLNCR